MTPSDRMLATTAKPTPGRVCTPRSRSIHEVPLHEKQALDYREVQALGFCAERTLRRLVTAGKVVRAVLRNGARVKFLRDVLIEELREAQE